MGYAGIDGLPIFVRRRYSAAQENGSTGTEAETEKTEAID